MARYKTKPCEIEAIQWMGDNLEEIIRFAKSSLIWNTIYNGLGQLLGYEISIETLKGTMLVSKGDYIIRGLSGEFYPCREEVFKRNYEVIK